MGLMERIRIRSYPAVAAGARILKAINAESRTLRRNTNLYNRAMTASARFAAANKILKQQKAEGILTATGLKKAEKRVAALSKASADLAQRVLAVSDLIQITPEHGDAVIEQVLHHEKVHPVEDKTQLLQTRLGFEGMNKDCQALTIQTNDGPKILAQIFRYHVRITSTENGKIDPRDYPGDVEVVRDDQITQLNGSENHSCYYTISSVFKGSGPLLVAGLQYVEPGLNEITISPATSFYKAVNIQEILASKNDTEIRQAYFDFIRDGNDAVANFHLGNGASIGWIHVNRHADQHYIVVNYVYDREMLPRNQVNLSQGRVPTSNVLCEELGSSYTDKTRNVGEQSAPELKRALDFAS